MAKKFFSYDPLEGMLFWDTAEQAKAEAERALSGNVDFGEWSSQEDEIELICWGAVTEAATCTLRKERPSLAELDNEGYSKDGTWWGRNVDSILDFKMKPISEHMEPIRAKP